MKDLAAPERVKCRSSTSSALQPGRSAVTQPLRALRGSCSTAVQWRSSQRGYLQEPRRTRRVRQPRDVRSPRLERLVAEPAELCALLLEAVVILVPPSWCTLAAQHSSATRSSRPRPVTARSPDARC